jgi:hypothetical protein
MPDRREFLKSVAAGTAAARGITPGRSAQTADRPPTRAYWATMIERIATPVLKGFATGRIRDLMPVEAVPGAVDDRRTYTHLEALGRTLAGLAPWLEAPSLRPEEAARRDTLLELARTAIAQATDPRSPAYVNLSSGGQPLVDAAFLAQAMLRAPDALCRTLAPAVRANAAAALRATHTIRPPFNNWLLFAATIETALKMMGEPWDVVRVDYAIRQHEQWYKGDGAYGDGPTFHWDYYNSFVIHPMLVDILASVGEENPAWEGLVPALHARAKRYAAVQERMIAPDGSYPLVGRSLAYRCGAFHLLAQSALRRELPDAVRPAQVREALTAVIRRTLEATGTFDPNGWLTIGLAGHQPALAERYISTGSLYLCATAFLPLGLPPSDPFWSDPEAPWTSKHAWAGGDLAPDHALD